MPLNFQRSFCCQSKEPLSLSTPERLRSFEISKLNFAVPHSRLILPDPLAEPAEAVTTVKLGVQVASAVGVIVVVVVVLRFLGVY